MSKRLCATMASTNPTSTCSHINGNNRYRHTIVKPVTSNFKVYPATSLVHEQGLNERHQVLTTHWAAKKANIVIAITQPAWMPHPLATAADTTKAVKQISIRFE
ncbi:MAG: hypothetical protein CMF46_03475 [Legionellales bacterium]|nr:hypothetical protein [Legionellales bacterium]